MKKKFKNQKIRFKSKKSDLNQKNPIFSIFLNHDFFQPCVTVNNCTRGQPLPQSATVGLHSPQPVSYYSFSTMLRVGG